MIAIPSRQSCTAALLLVAVCAIGARTAQGNPNAAYVFPGGGCRGTTFDVVVGGQRMSPPKAREGLDYDIVITGSRIKDVADVFISGEGVKAEVVSWYRPMTQGESVRIGIESTAKMEEVEKKQGRKITREEAYELLGITEEHLEEQKKYQKRSNDPKRQPNPQIEEELTVRITLAPDAEVGPRELRILTESGMSNPRWFHVGQWPELREQEPNDVQPHPDVKIPLPSVINGQVMPGDVDRLAFQAKKGAKLVAHCAAREVIPYIADGVPGWFQAVLRLYDDRGREVAFADSLGFRHDPVLYYEVPRDGTYVLEVRDSIYRGREDFIYRISIGEIPYITGIFPLGGRSGKPAEIELLGWNLPVNTLRIEPAFDRGRTIHPIIVEKDKISTNRVGFIMDNLSETLDNEPNDSIETAQRVNMPLVINGRIERPGDVDYFRIEGAGAVVAEVFARRLYSPLDSVVRLHDSRGRVVDQNDDHEDRGWPLITHHADSRLITVAQGARYISITDAQGQGGPDFAYRLYLRPPRPDFDLRVTPSSVSARAGTCVPISVHAIRKDGFDDDIMFELENPPPGFSLSGAWIPAGQNSSRLTLTVPQDASPKPFMLQINGASGPRSKHRVARPAFPAEEMMQAFIWYHLVPTQNWTIFVNGKPPGKPPCSFMDRAIQIPADGTGMLRVMVENAQTAAALRFELSQAPEGITIEDPVVVSPGLVVPIKCDAKKAKPGLKGNLIFMVFREGVTPPKEPGAQPTTWRQELGMFPAVPFEIVSRR
jgi:hypothetical protein